LTDLVSQQNLSGFPLVVAFLLAFGFGCAHALTPGHGKTMVAAYLVGERGTPKHAILLGLTTTVTHTISVFALGVAMYFLAGSFAPDRVTRILELISGASIALLGAWLLYRRALQLRNIDPDLAHGHTHEAPPIPENAGQVSLASLLALGASGGLVPCPSALVLLLSSIALGRIGLGLFLLISFSLGLASVLVGIGMAVLYAKNFLPERASSSAWLRYTPVASACFIIAVGVFLTGTALRPR
jgi:nickel/cobalt transporter (NicO) family protein